MFFFWFLSIKKNFDGKLCCIVFKTAFFLSGRTFVEEFEIFRKILLLMFILVLCAETYQTFGNKFLAELLRQHSSCPNGNFEVKIFRSKMKLFINIVKHWAKKCRLLAKNVRHGCHSWFLCVEENFLWKMKGLEKIILLIFFSGLWVETFWAVGDKINGMLFKEAFYRFRGMIHGKLFC